MKKQAVRWALLFCAMLLVPQMSYGHMGDLFGLNMRSLSMANAYTALAEGPTAAFYNPALLADQSGVQMEASYLYTLPMFDLELRDPDSTEDLENSGALDKANDLRGAQYIGFGVSGRIIDYVGLGVYMNMPISGSTYDRFFQPQNPYWLRYETSIQGFQIYPAVSVRIIPNVMLGVGATINLDSSGNVDLDIPLFEDEPLANVDGTGKWSAGLSINAGVFYRPMEFLQFGFTYRGENYIHYEQTMTLYPNGKDGVSVPVDVSADTGYLPQQFILGAVGKPFEWWTISLDAVYTSWSQYKPPYPELDIDYMDLDENDIDYDMATVIEQDTGDVEFADTLTLKLGLEFTPVKYFNIRTGYSYEPTPVPDQDGTTNILDANMHVIALGFGVNYGGEDNNFVRVDLGGQFHLIADRDIEKDTAEMDPYYSGDGEPEMNPGYPEVDVESNYFVGGLSVKFRF